MPPRSRRSAAASSGVTVSRAAQPSGPQVRQASGSGGSVADREREPVGQVERQAGRDLELWRLLRKQREPQHLGAAPTGDRGIGQAGAGGAVEPPVGEAAHRHPGVRRVGERRRREQDRDKCQLCQCLVKHDRLPRSSLLHPPPAVCRHAVEGPARRGRRPRRSSQKGVHPVSACAGPSMIRRCRRHRAPRKDYTHVFDSHQRQLDGGPPDPEGDQQGHGEGPGRDLDRPQGRDRQGQRRGLGDRPDDEVRRPQPHQGRGGAVARLGHGRHRAHRRRVDLRDAVARQGVRARRR